MFSLAQWKLWALGGVLALAFVGIFLWRVFDAGKNEQKIKTFEATLETVRRAAEARAQERSKPTDAKVDEFNRDNRGAR